MATGYCLTCGKEIEVQMCCSGRECGCGGQPEFPFCSDGCYDTYTNGVKQHECNELAAVYALKSGERFFFTDDKEADKWCKENGPNIVMGSVACSICKKAAIDTEFKMALV